LSSLHASHYLLSIGNSVWLHLKLWNKPLLLVDYPLGVRSYRL
jgi:hypothetical protein